MMRLERIQLNRPRPQLTRPRNLLHGISRATASSSSPQSHDQGSETPSHSKSDARLSNQPETKPSEKTSGILAWAQNMVIGSKEARQKVVELGFGGFAAYSVISNINAGLKITIAWMMIVKQTGKTPLAEGNWAPFLAAYGAIWATSHLLRPLRLSLAVVTAPFFDKLLAKISQVTGTTNKFVSWIIMLLGIATFSICFLTSVIFISGGFV